MDILQQELFYHDSNRRDLLISSLQNGFNIGYAGPHFTLISNNLKSAYDYPDALSQNILIELQEDRIAGPFLEPPLLNFRTSPIGIIPKKEPNKFRTITDLSSPAGKSINDFIPSSESAVQFNHFDKAVEIVAKLGQGSLMAKLDIKSAFRLCPVRKSDWHLLGFSFQNLYFVDLCLPFGLRSSVNRFTQLADAVLWILQNNYNIVNSTNYLDDYFLAGPARRKTCSEHLDCAMNVFSKLGIPLAPEKVIGPTETITYLGIVIDTNQMELRLPEDKIKDLNVLLETYKANKKITKRKLLSLIGKLSFASKIIPSGRTFLRRLINLSTTVDKLSHHISLNSEAREDINWWLSFLPLWNGRQKILDPNVTLSPHINLFTDASGQAGFGIYFNGKWVAHPWPAQFTSTSIQWKELFPIYLACFLWSKEFSQKRSLFHCDNITVTNIWRTGTSKCPKIMALIRKLFFLAAQNNFTVNVSHIKGTNNAIADALSRLQLHKFRQLAPMASLHPTPIPAEAWKV